MPFLFGHQRTTATAFVRLQTRRCEACWECRTHCREQVIGAVDVFGHRHAVLRNPDACSGCLACVRACGTGALTALCDAAEIAARKQRPSTNLQRGIPMNNSPAAPAAPSTRTRFNTRAFVSVALCAAGLLLPYSGYMCHLLGAEPLSPARHCWMSVHNAAAMLFLASAITHTVLNRKALGRHLRRAGAAVASREAVAALALVAAFVGLVAMHALHAR